MGQESGPVISGEGVIGGSGNTGTQYLLPGLDMGPLGLTPAKATGMQEW